MTTPPEKNNEHPTSLPPPPIPARQDEVVPEHTRIPRYVGYRLLSYALIIQGVILWIGCSAPATNVNELIPLAAAEVYCVLAAVAGIGLVHYQAWARVMACITLGVFGVYLIGCGVSLIFPIAGLTLDTAVLGFLLGAPFTYLLALRPLLALCRPEVIAACK